MMSHSGQSCHLQCWHPRSVPVKILAVSLTIGPLADGPGKAVKDSPSAWTSDTLIADPEEAYGS